MASLQKIRSHGVLLLIIVGLAMLAFILGDFFSSSSSFFNRGREYVGKVDGENIHITDFENQREQLTEVYKIESGRQDFDEDMQANINNQAWQMLVMNKTLNSQAKRIGMAITADELSEQCIGENPHQIIRQRRVFADENGQFNRQNLIQFYESVFNNDAADASQLKQARNYWMYWEKAVQLTYLQEKYTDLLQELIGANKLDAQYAWAGVQTSVDAQFVGKQYSAIADSTINVSKSEVRNLYQKRKEQYKQTPNATIEYVIFPIVASEEDFADVEKWINRVKDEFTTTDDIAGVTNSNSDVLYTGANYSETTIPEQYKEFAFAKGRKAGDVTEIQLQDDIYSMARIVEAGYSLPDSVELRYAQLQSADQLDSLKAEWKKNNFGDANELGWLKESDLPKEIAEKAFKAKKNEIVTNEFGTGLQVIQVMNTAAATPKVKMAILARQVTPSSKTYSAIYNQAKQFIVNNTTEDAFRNAAAEQGLTVEPAYNVQKNQNKVGDLKQSRQIVRWAFKAKQGEVSDVFECGDDFVAAVLTELKSGDYQSFEDVEAELRRELVKDKKAEQIIKSLKGITTLEDAATALNSQIQTAQGINLGSYRFGSAGNEPALVGTALGLNENEISAPVKGNQGVYVVLDTKKTQPAGEPDVEQQISQLNQRYSYSLPYQAINLLQEKIKVEDNRANFY